jgi:entericidin B
MKMKKIACAVLVIALTSLAGCNTIRGIGQDIEKGGEALQNSTK